jgi:replicative DNA helicase Mcm
VKAVNDSRVVQADEARYASLSSVKDAELAVQWDDFLQAYGRDVVNQAALAWPDQTSVTFDFRDIQVRNPALADYILAKPRHALQMAALRVQELEVPVPDPKPRLLVRVRDLPKKLRVGPRQLRSEHLGRLVAVSGVITAASPTLLDLVEAAFDCKTCGNRVRVPQEIGEARIEPVICDGCEKTGPWKLREEESRHLDAQQLRLQETPETVRGGETPEILGIRVHEDLVQSITPGSRVVALGVMTVKYRKSNGKHQTEAEPLLQGIHIQPDESELVDLLTTPEEMQEFTDLAAKPSVHDELSRCLAPSVLGMGDVKLAILMALVGGPEWTRPDGSRVRGRIHVLLAGDPGTAKSKVIGRIKRYVQRCVHVLGVEASRAGLSVAAVKDQDGRWMLEAGALVMAHKHVLTLDELGHLDPEDQPGLLSSMEDGYVKSDRVVKATLPAETTVIAAMNPIHGRFDRYTPLMEQLGISAPLKSRFDLKYCLLDSVDAGQDRDLADSVLDDEDQDAKDERTHYGVALGGDQLRRYIHVARQKAPRMSAEALEHLKEYYSQVRNQDRDNPPFTARQLEALRRLAGASARLRLADTIDLQDAERAVAMMSASLRSCRIMDDAGRLDGDLMQFGQSKTQHDRLRLVQQAVKDLQRGHPNGYHRGVAHESDIFASCLAKELTHDDITQALATLRRNKTIYQRGGPGEYAILSA